MTLAERIIKALDDELIFKYYPEAEIVFKIDNTKQIKLEVNNVNDFARRHIIEDIYSILKER